MDEVFSMPKRGRNVNISPTILSEDISILKSVKHFRNIDMGGCRGPRSSEKT